MKLNTSPADSYKAIPSPSYIYNYCLFCMDSTSDWWLSIKCGWRNIRENFLHKWMEHFSRRNYAQTVIDHSSFRNMLRIRQNFREAASRKQRWMTYRKAVIFRLLLSLPLSIKENSELSSIKALWASAGLFLLPFVKLVCVDIMTNPGEELLFAESRKPGL